MGNRGTEDHRLWLHDLAHDNISEERMIKGFLRFYALEDCVPGDVTDDLIWSDQCGLHEAEKTVERLKAVLGQAVEGAIRMEADA